MLILVFVSSGRRLPSSDEEDVPLSTFNTQESCIFNSVKQYDKDGKLYNEFISVIECRNSHDLMANLQDWQNLKCEESLLYYKVMKFRGSESKFFAHLLTVTDVSLNFVQNMLIPTKNRITCLTKHHHIYYYTI